MASIDAMTNAFLLVYAALFPIVNPIADAPIFLGLTEFCTDAQRQGLARRVAINSFFLLVGSMFIGSHVLEFFGISLPVVRIGGGLVVSAFGWKLLNAEPSPDAPRVEPDVRATTPDPFYPLTMPLTVGPGSISVAITLGTQLPKIAGAEQLALTIRHRRGRGITRHGADRIFLLPLCAAAGQTAWAARYAGRGKTVRLHTAMHRHPDIVGRLE